MFNANDKNRGWRKVIRKKSWRMDEGLWDIAVGSTKRVMGMEVTSFFITEFGDNWKARDLLFEMKELGEVIEVVIPSKMDRRGRMYGFVRFANVEDENMLAIKLDNVILDGRNMCANMPRFQRSQATGTS